MLLRMSVESALVATLAMLKTMARMSVTNVNLTKVQMRHPVMVVMMCQTGR